MKNKTGKKLENLVTQIERLFNPSTVQIETNEKVVVNGVNYAEFDIVVRGRFGSTKIAWLIECRDRPSVGREGRPWIEQLAGRKLIEGFNKITAVSTTGYTEPAIDAGKRLGVELREVKNLEEDKIDWISSISANFIYHLTKAKEANPTLVSNTSENGQKIFNDLFDKKNIEEKIVSRTDTDNKFSFQDLFLELANASEDYDRLYNLVEVDSEGLEVTLCAEPRDEIYFEIELGEKVFLFENIVIKGILSKISIPQVFIEAFNYQNQGKAEKIASQKNYSLPITKDNSLKVSYTDTKEVSQITISYSGNEKME